MKTLNAFNKLSLATALSTMLAASAFAGSDTQEKQQQEHREGRTAEQYWKEFKHDSGEAWQDTKSAFRDGWLEGKLETAIIMNEQLNPFDIDLEVNGSTAILEGEVTSDIVKDHAKYVALSVEGIDEVENKLKVNKDAKINDKKTNERSISRTLKDATITAGVKAELLASPEIKGLKIDVDTAEGEVTLTGKVDSSAKRALAEYIAKDVRGVKGVVNNLKVQS